MNKREREQRRWWYADVDYVRVREVLGLSCKPDHPDVWWCPEVGSSLSEGHHLFLTEVEARTKVKNAVAEQLDRLRERLRQFLDGSRA
jgi:hypothetical protein